MIEINCDLGEGIPNEELIYPLIDAASIACGGHFGNESTVRSSLIKAKKFQKKIGAHPSYPDPENFGRKTLSIDFEVLKTSILEQIHLFLKIANELDLPMDHIKFHGALYNDAASQPELAEKLCELIALHFPDTTLFTPPYSQTIKFAKVKELKIRTEIFGDRGYQDNYQLMSRDKANSLFTTKDEIETHLKPILNTHKIISFSGKELPISADTLCFHGDNPGLHEFLPQIRKEFWT